jgi:glucosylglycerate hydrolase
MTSTILDSDTMHEAAVNVLRRNDLGRITSAAPDLYPHQWSWDAAFVGIGLARVDVPRAIIELRSLLAAQWSTGILPHIVFAATSGDYFPGPERWHTDRIPARPPELRTSGICQPPVHAIAVRLVGYPSGRTPRRRYQSSAAAAECFARPASLCCPPPAP